MCYNKVSNLKEVEKMESMQSRRRIWFMKVQEVAHARAERAEMFGVPDSTKEETECPDRLFCPLYQDDRCNDGYCSHRHSVK